MDRSIPQLLRSRSKIPPDKQGRKSQTKWSTPIRCVRMRKPEDEAHRGSSVPSFYGVLSFNGGGCVVSFRDGKVFPQKEK
eukprot:c24274_g5_i1 orf=3-239(-)